MVTSSQTLIARLARSAAVSALGVVPFFALLGVAQAQAPSAPFVAPHAMPAAAPAGMPAVTSAVVGQTVRPQPVAALQPPPAPQIACSAPAEFSHFDRPLLRTMARLASGEPLTIVAIGSSSTAGAGASSPAASYPSRLAADLKQRFPGHDITVINRGINGEETDQMMARFDTGVIAEHPQLVLWQVGTNSVLRERPLDAHAEQLREGVDRLKATGADLVLIDLQFTPAVVAKSETAAMVEQIARVAKDKNVDLFRRFAVMRDWYAVQHLAFDAFASPDALHMNDWGYGCLAKLLGVAIAEAATRPIVAAAAHPAGAPNSP
jgi:lysophospholipase L1-like esterase